MSALCPSGSCRRRYRRPAVKLRSTRRSLASRDRATAARTLAGRRPGARRSFTAPPAARPRGVDRPPRRASRRPSTTPHATRSAPPLGPRLLEPQIHSEISERVVGGHPDPDEQPRRHLGHAERARGGPEPRELTAQDNRQIERALIHDSLPARASAERSRSSSTPISVGPVSRMETLPRWIVAFQP